MVGLDEHDPLVTDLIEASRALGSDDTLVLCGGGNTSVKTVWRDYTGAKVPVLLVKGSGADLATADRSGFAPLRLARLRELLPPTTIPADALAGELRCALLDPQAPDPSVETLVHALFDDVAVFHSHADALLVVTHAPGGADLLRRAFAGRLLIVDYAMPGPELAEACAQALSALDQHRRSELQGLIVLQHGLFTVGDTPRQALDRHLSLVAEASRLFEATTASATAEFPPLDLAALARLRRAVADEAGRPVVARVDRCPDVAAFMAMPTLMAATAHGPLTPDHAIWTRPVPLIGRDVQGYAQECRRYVAEHAARTGRDIVVADAAPRIVLDSHLGLVAFGRTAREAESAAAIYRHTMTAISAAEANGGYQPLDMAHVFDLEYWAAQRAKLNRGHVPQPLAGQIALVTGAASGIGKACAESFLAAGAVVIGWDLASGVANTFDHPNWCGRTVDVTNAAQVADGVREIIGGYGGLDIVVVAAGIFPTSQPITELDPAAWRKVMAVNVDSVQQLYAEVGPFLALAPGGGRVVVIASRNVPAPGPGAAAYSASKAALTQLSRVAALEWAPAGVRVNMIHPDAVFDTGLWTPELLAARAAHYGMTVDEYKRRNLLKAEVTSADVGALALAMASAPFRCTTGAQVSLDGGNDRVI